MRTLKLAPSPFKSTLLGSSLLVVVLVSIDRASAQTPVTPPSSTSDTPSTEETVATGETAASLPGSPEDSEAEKTLAAAFRQVPALAGVAATVRDRVITLTGEAESPAARQSAEEIAREIDQVVFINNLIEVAEVATEARAERDPTIHDQVIRDSLASVFEQVESLRDVTVTVRGGVVILKGEASSADVITEATELAQSRDGVVYVDNRIEESKQITKRLTPLIDRFYRLVRDIIASLPLTAIALVVLFGAYLLSKRVRALNFSRLEYLRGNALLLGIVRRCVSIAVLLAGLFVALQIMGMGFVLGAILGGAGIVGVALSFAFRDIIENFLAGVILSIRQPFYPKDIIKVNDEQGTVIRMTPSATILMTVEGNHVRIPNADVFKGIVTNMTRNPNQRFDFDVGVAPDADLNRARKLGVDSMRKLPGVLPDPEPFAWVESIGDSSIQLAFHGWVDQREASVAKVKGASIREVLEALAQGGIEMPEPTYRITMVENGTPIKQDALAEHEIAPTSTNQVAPKPHRAASPATHASDDTSPDLTIEAQIDAERAAAHDEADLLTE